MAGPQPGEHPATGALPTQPPPTDPTPSGPTPSGPTVSGPTPSGPTVSGPTPSGPTPEPELGPEPTTVDPTTDQLAATAPAAAPEPSATAARDDEPTGTITPRWTGSAAIPPRTPRRRWWHRLTPSPGAPAPTAAPGAATQPVAISRPARGGPAAPLDPTRAEITRRQPEPLNRTAIMPDPAEVGAASAFSPEPEEPYRERSYQDWENTPPVDPWAGQDSLWQAAPGAPVAPPAPVGPPAGPFPPAVFGRSALPPTLTGPAGPATARAGTTPHPSSTTPPTPTTPASGRDGHGAPDPHARGAGGEGTAAPAAADRPGAPSWRRRLFTRPSSRTARPATGTTAAGGPATTAAGGRAGSAASATQGPVPPWWNPPNAAARPPEALGTRTPSSWAQRAQPLVQGGSALRLPPAAPVPPPGWAPAGRAGQGGEPPPATAPTRPPAPPKGKPAKAPKESRADRKRRMRTGDLPPPWSPPTPGPPPPRRRRRRRRLRLGILLLIALLVAAYWYGGAAVLGLPYAGQYPVSPSLPERVADLHLRHDASSNRTAQRLTQSLHDAGVAADEVFAGVYGDGNGKRVAVFGTTGFRWSPHADVENEIGRLAAVYDLTDIESYELGETGAHERCGVGRSDGTSVVVCSWADHGSLGSAVLTRRSAADSAEVVGLLRKAVLSRP